VSLWRLLPSTVQTSIVDRHTLIDRCSNVYLTYGVGMISMVFSSLVIGAQHTVQQVVPTAFASHHS
jgi:hypothetical protein